MNKLITTGLSCMVMATSFAAIFNGSKSTDFGDIANWDEYPVAGGTIEIADGKTAVVDGTVASQTQLLASLVSAKIGADSILRVVNYPDGQTFTLAAGKLALTGTGSFEFVCDSTNDSVVHGGVSIASDNSAFKGSFKFDNVAVYVNSIGALGSGCPISYRVPALYPTNYRPFNYLKSGVYDHPLTISNTKSYFVIRASGCAVTNKGEIVAAAGNSRPVRLCSQSGAYFAQEGEVTINGSYLLLTGQVGLPGTNKMTFAASTYVSASDSGDRVDYGKRKISATVASGEQAYRPLQINKGTWRMLADNALNEVPFSFGPGDTTSSVTLDLNGHSMYLGYSSQGYKGERQLKVLKGRKNITSSSGPATGTIAATVIGYDGSSESTFTTGRYIDATLGGMVTMKANFPASGIADTTWYVGFLTPEGTDAATTCGSLLAAYGTVRLTAKSRYSNLNKLDVTGNNGNFYVTGTPTLGGHTALVMSRSSKDTKRTDGYVRINENQTLTVATASDAGTAIAAGTYTKASLPNVLASAGTGSLIVTGRPTITAKDVMNAFCVLDGTGFLSSTVLTMTAEELAKVPRKQGGELLSYKIAENVATMPSLSPALASTPGWKVQLIEGSLYLMGTQTGLVLVVR